MDFKDMDSGPGQGMSASGTGPDLSKEYQATSVAENADKDVADGVTPLSGSLKQAGGSALSGAGKVGYGMLALGVNATRGGANVVKNIGKRVAAMLLTGGASLSSALGGAISPQAGAYVVGGGSVVSTVAAAALVGSLVGAPQPAKFGASEEKCEVSQGVELDSVGDLGDMEDNAKKVYAILSGMGMSDENIAGIFGNWETESGMDPTAVETIHDEPGTLGPKKKEAEKTDFDGARLGLGVDKAGIGLGQWTNERNTNMRKFAEGKDRDWYDMEAQLAYALVEPGDGETFKKMVENKSPGSDNPEEAAGYFLKEWERPGSTYEAQYAVRAPRASKWFAKMGGWSADKSAADSVLALAEEEVSAATTQSNMDQMVSCEVDSSNTGGNADAAEAMATIAWPKKEMSAGNDGTYTYIWVNDKVLKEHMYQSCDRGVATAVRWSGTDDSYLPGNTSLQYQYLKTSDKWEEVQGWQNDHSKLKPGDVFVTKGDGHTFMFTGKEAIQKIWGDTEYADDVKNSDVGEASLNDRSPGLRTLGENESVHDSGTPYAVFRNREPEQHSKFKKLSPPSKYKMATGPGTSTPV